ncbi:DNA polymerase III subunit gamma/tau [Reinekea thalattae]|uniref:DNA polymerase III subunit gamma/tau n=1 Tax=Reinekea thalattae TaxID=2593301 RepID=A0A5C8Z7Q5_9GAMM|nr:DNA polymerase III subunit gamma/tau [Reinekea thalattae]TXR53278.1 DNA polymerase III subunit gamma/tau [Reinekea thalattae]
MSYQVLARKWRPATFAEMVGQVHVLRALINALDQQRLHHAYLFTGTRGVGKTTIARLLAKSLNCEQGVSSKPCGVCSSCKEISEGRFVDLIEVDAASRTKVEDTRELLDNVQYAPTRGRYKVYLIDEVHMLSSSSFNALLKTLEEPPEHVKFLLATTDPQKLPVTVLSRCLQFNLKNMTRENIVSHLNHILAEEQVPHDQGSLWSIAEAAAGSMRDALSLTDQAIAFGEGALKDSDVSAMLGSVDLKRVLRFAVALFERNVDQLMALTAEVDEHSPDYQALMTELMSVLHRTAIAQAAPTAIDNSKGDRNAIVKLAGAVQPEDVHLYYQIAAKAKPEMPLAPSERAGFEMALLRMVAFSQTPVSNIGELPELSAQQHQADPEAVEADATPAKKSELINQAESALEPDALADQQATSDNAESNPELEPEPESSITDSSIVDSSIVDSSIDSTAVIAESSGQADSQSVTPVEEHASESVSLAEPIVDEQTIIAPEPEAEVLQAEFVQASVDEAVTSVDEVETPEALATSEIEPAERFEPQGVESQGVESQGVEPQSIDSENTASHELLSSNVDQAEPEKAPGQSEDRVAKAQWPATDRNEDPVFWWQVNLHRLGLQGMTKTLFAHSQWLGFEGDTLSLNISPNYRKIMNDSHQEKLMQALADWLPGCRRLAFEFAPVELTPQLWLDQLVQASKDQAYQYLQQDPFITQLVNEFEAQLQRESAVTNHNPIPSGE